MTAAQLRMKLRQAQTRQRHAINRYNAEVRRINREQQAAIRRLRNL